MRNSSPSVRSRAPELALVACALVLAGVGCDLDGRIGVRNPFTELPPPEDRSAETTAAIVRAPGARISLHPSYLGVTGAALDLLGTGQAYEAEVVASGPASASFSWKRGEASGSVSSDGFADGHALLLPAFWKDGERSADGNGLLWLSPAAYAELAEGGATDIRIGLGDGAFDAASKALSAFDAIARRLSLAATSTPEAARKPFAASVASESTVFPLRVDGRIERVRVIQAKSWFAEFTVLKNPENPLVLKVSVNPVAMEALRAFAPEGVDPQAVGYEVTSVSTSARRPSSP